MTKAILIIDFCDYKAAKYAVEHWHYSRSMPAGKVVKIGVWENSIFIGVILFSRGANNNIGSPYGLGVTEICELTRVALNQHVNPVSKILAIAIKMLSKQSPGLKLVVSYADQNQGHHGGIYQACNWVYVGGTKISQARVKLSNGKVVHLRTFNSKHGNIAPIQVGAEYFFDAYPKYKYLYPLTPEMRDKIEPLRKPYPKRANLV